MNIMFDALEASISRSRRNCSVVGCNYTYRNSPPGTKFFSFPNDKQHIIRRKAWITAVRRQGVDGNPWAPTRNSRVCSRHFVNGTPTRDPDSPGYVPKLYLKPASPGQHEQKMEIAEVTRNKIKKLRHGKELVDNDLVEPCSDANTQTDIMNVYLMEEITIKEEAVWPKEERSDDDEASAVDGLASSFPLDDIVVKTEPIKVEAVESNQIELHKTGDGGFKKPTVDETGQKLIAALQAQFLLLANPFDDDANFYPEVMSELQSGNDVISVPTSAETSAIRAQEEDHFIVLEEIPVQEEVLGNICIEQAPASKSANLLSALPSTSTSKTADVLTKSRAPKRKRKTDSVLEAKRLFYKRRLECLEAEHKIKMENIKLDNEIKHLEILEKRRKLGLDNQ